MRLEQDGGGDGEAEGPSNLEINDQIECGRLLDWQIGGFGAFQDLVHIAGSASLHIRHVWP